MVDPCYTGGVLKKKSNVARLVIVQQQLNKAHNSLLAIGERGNGPLRTTFKELRNVSLNPWRIERIIAAVLAILHVEHARTT